MIALLAPHRSATTSSGYSGSSSDYCKTGSVYVRFYQAPAPSSLKILRNSMKLQDTRVKAVSGWPRTPTVQENPHPKLRAGGATTEALNRARLPFCWLRFLRSSLLRGNNRVSHPRIQEFNLRARAERERRPRVAPRCARLPGPHGRQLVCLALR